MTLSSRRSVENAAFISWDHVLDVDECVFTSVLFEKFEGLLNVVTDVQSLALSVFNLVTQVSVLGLQEVKDGQDLTVVGHESFSDGV